MVRMINSDLDHAVPSKCRWAGRRLLESTRSGQPQDPVVLHVGETGGLSGAPQALA